MLFVMLFIIVLLIAMLIAVSSILFGVLCYFTCTKEEINNLRNAGRDKLTFFEYWIAQYALWCVDTSTYALEQYIIIPRKEA